MFSLNRIFQNIKTAFWNLYLLQFPMDIFFLALSSHRVRRLCSLPRLRMALCPLIICGIYYPLLLRLPETRRFLFCVAQSRLRSEKWDSEWVNNLEKKMYESKLTGLLLNIYFITFYRFIWESKDLQFLSNVLPLCLLYSHGQNY